MRASAPRRRMSPMRPGRAATGAGVRRPCLRVDGQRRRHAALVEDRGHHDQPAVVEADEQNRPSSSTGRQRLKIGDFVARCPRALVRTVGEEAGQRRHSEHQSSASASRLLRVMPGRGGSWVGGARHGPDVVWRRGRRQPPQQHEQDAGRHHPATERNPQKRTHPLPLARTMPCQRATEQAFAHRRGASRQSAGLRVAA